MTQSFPPWQSCVLLWWECSNLLLDSDVTDKASFLIGLTCAYPNLTMSIVFSTSDVSLQYEQFLTRNIASPFIHYTISPHLLLRTLGCGYAI